MSWFNYYGLAIMAIIMVPNIIYFIRHKNDASNTYKNKVFVIGEQVGRYGCFLLMIFNIPYTYFNFWFNHALTAYLIVNGSLCVAYLVFWAICWNKNNKLKAISLSVIPSSIFIFSGIVLANIPLMFFAIVFSVCHILLSCTNIIKKNRKKVTMNEKAQNEFIIIFITILVALAIVGIIFGADAGGAFPLN